MTNVATFLLFILLPATVLAQVAVDENDMVQCFNDQSSCNANSNVMMITAGQCCNSTGGSTRRVRVSGTCASCFTVTFSQRSYHFEPANKGETVPIPVTVSYFSGTGNYNVRLRVRNNPDPIPDSSQFIADLSQNILQYTPTTTSQNFTMTLATEGNQIALDDDLMFTLEMSLSGTPIFSGGFAIIVLSSASVTIGDLDVVTISFERSSYEAQESSQSVSVVVSRGTISFSNAFNVTVTTREYSGDPSTLLHLDQSIATPNVDYRDGESMTKTFEAYTADTERTFQFYIKDDTTVELDEVFDVFITVNDSRVNIERDVSFAVISDDEKFSIGFRETMHTIREGENVTLIVDEYQGFVGGKNVSGVPVERLTGSFLRFSSVESKAVENVDFAINRTLPRFTYSLNNTINSIFIPFKSIADTVLETSEIAVLEIRLNQTDRFIQIHNNIVQRVTITILDNNLATVRLSARKYNVSESVGTFPGMMVCADFINATLGSGQNLQVNFNLSDGSALKTQDYFQTFFDSKFFTFSGPATRACITIRITNDNIKEPLLEFFNITLLPYDPVSSPTPGITGLTVDTTPSSICIEDDDQVEVRFERSNVTFSEADGDQNIYVILDGGQISNNQTVEVYDIRTNKTLGIVTFVSGVQPPQRQPFVFSVVNNNIALEFDKLTRLSLRNYGQLQEGTPFTMNVTVVDDDAVIVNFDRALYPYSENHGVVSDINITLSTEIAQDLTVTVSGGPGSQPSTVNISGVNVNEVITFTAHGSLSKRLSSFTITNDAVALETIEQYDLSFSNPSITNRVTLGPDTRIQITDDDVVTVNFVQNLYSYREDHGLVSDMALILSTEIAQDLTVTASGGPGNQPSTVEVSGIDATVNIKFEAHGPQLERLPSLSFINDTVALETVERYNCSLSNPSITNGVILGPDAIIQIFDDDVVTVNFGKSLYPYSESHGIVSDITITLSTAIAQSLTVTVSGGPGSQPSTVNISGVNVNEVITFAARGNQSQGLPSFTIKNDAVALETIEQYDLSFSNPSITNNVTLGPDTTIQIRDNDVVTVNFGQSLYPYSESHGVVSDITITLSTAIAQSLTVTVSGGPGSQPSTVEISGVNVNEVITFAARGDQSQGLPSFTIKNDSFALETIEQYDLSFSNPSITNNVILGSDTTIQITDDDVVAINFGKSLYPYNENHGVVSDITITLSTAIAQSLTVTVSGGPGSQPSTVNISGVNVNEVITFAARRDQSQGLPSFTIKNDSFALETIEQYDLSFSNSSITNNVILGSDTTIQITDDDVVTINFGKSLYPYSENHGVVSDITITLSTAIAQSLTVTVSGGPGSQPSTVEISGVNVNEVITFAAHGDQSQGLPSFTIKNDSFALETIEQYDLSFSNSSITNNVILGSDTRIQITDDEVLRVDLDPPMSFYDEGQPANLRVTLSYVIVQDFSVDVNGSSGSQPRVSNSGPPINERVMYVARGARTVQIPFTIGNDDVAREDMESYQVALSNPSDTSAVLGTAATINIRDTDYANITFEQSQYVFLENAGLTMDVTVILSTRIAEGFTARVVGDPGVPPPTIVNSGSVVNYDITFLPFNNSIANLEKIIPVQIVNDSTSGEPDQMYDLTFVGVPTGTGTKAVNEYPYERTTIVIIDDDVARVFFNSPETRTFESDQGEYITVVLTGSISHNVSVDVVDDNGKLVRTVIFQPMAGISRQTMRFFVPYPDDIIALEPDEYFNYYLRNPVDVIISSPNTTRHRLVDDDVLLVTFVQSAYDFNENDQSVYIEAEISNPIARTFTVSTTFLRQQIQPFVSISGPLFTDTLIYQPNRTRTLRVNGFVRNDDIALEDVETYFVRFINPDPSPSVNPYVRIGNDTLISVFDDDTVNVTFSPGNHFVEAQTTEQIAVRINAPIIRDLQVNIRSTPQPDPLVEQSGSSYTTSVTFPSQGNTIQLFTFPIKDDIVAFENVENVELSFINSSYTNGVILGSNEIATITDPDGVTVMFVDSVKNDFENKTSVTVQLMTSNIIKRNVSVRVRGGPNRSQQFVEFSGTDVDQYVIFVADGSNKASFTFALNDDMKALEVTETYQLYLNGSMPSQNVNLGGPMTVNIFDDDYLNVMFGQSEYVFYENVSMGSVMVKIDKEILQDFTIQVTGRPGTQPMTVVISGSNVNSTAAFTAGGSLMTTVTFIISDDSVSLEDDEEYFLYLQNPNPSTRVIVGDRTKIIIKDDDPLVYGFVDSFRTFIENGGNGTFNFVVSRTAKPTSYNMTMKRILPSNIVRSLLDLDCGQDASGILNVPASTASDAVVTCTAVIQDDIIALEDDETVTITATLVTPNPSTIMVTPGRSTLPVTVQDDDEPIVTMVDSTKDVTEGDMVEICIQVNKTSVRNIIVRLRTDDGTAKSGFDYTDGEKTLIIPPGSQGPICVNYTTLPDTLNEGDENFNVRIISVSSTTPNSADPTQPVMGSPDTTNVIIKDVAPPTRTCTVDGITGRLSTFNNLDNYIYNRSCEHILVIQQTTYGEFAIVIDTLDGTYRTARLGVRLGNETLVISAANLTVLKSVNLRLIVVNAGTNSIEITIAQFGLRIRVTNESITIDIETGFLNFHLGLCGNVMGNLVFRNSTVVNTSDPKALNKAINQYLVPPSETIARTVTRRHCGLLVEDVETGDPMYAVPLYTPDQSKPHTYSICYEVLGEANRYFNFISDECTSVNAHYFGTADPDPDSTRDFHGVDGVYVLAVNNDKQCVNITVSLDQINDCDTTLNGGTISSYKHRGISVQVAGNTTNITVPNCVDGALTMQVICKATANGVKFQEFRVIRGLNLNEESHGLIGQFWNVKSVVTKYDTPLRDGTVSPQAYKIELQPKNKPTRTFIGFLEDVTWDFTPQQCLYVGNAQAGPINEAADGEPNDSLIEGDYTQYIMDSSYDVGFTYQHFNSQC